MTAVHPQAVSRKNDSTITTAPNQSKHYESASAADVNSTQTQVLTKRPGHNTPSTSIPDQNPTSTTSASNQSESASATAVKKGSDQYDVAMNVLAHFQPFRRPIADRVTPAGSDNATSASANDLVTQFTKMKIAHIEFIHKLREIELRSYREDLAFQRGVMLFLAYVMGSVFTALSLWVNFVFAVKFDVAAQYDWISAAAFAMAFDLLALSSFRIFMIWSMPKYALVIALLVFMVVTILFGTFCGDDTTDEGALVVLRCTVDITD